jgi:nucleoside-diphosphate-sugar epimerase
MENPAGSVLVTGANGFVGRVVCRQLIQAGYTVRGAGRALDPTQVAENLFAVGDIGPDTDWTQALSGIDIVIHLAARAHLLKDTAAAPLSEFRRVNTAGTERLARMAAQTKVRRFVYVSSIGVNGDLTSEQPYSESDAPHPHNPYAISKWEAEQSLHQIAQNAGIEVAIVRPPLVYGPEVPANFRRLLGLVYRGIPLPLAGVHNRRSFVNVENLANFLGCCAEHPSAKNETFLISDGQDLSTADLFRQLAAAMGRPARLFPFLQEPLRLAVRVLGKEKMFNQLFGSLAVDSSKAKNLLSWTPPVAVHDGLAATARWYVTHRRG